MHKVILVLDYLLEIWRRVKLTHLPEKTTLKKSSLNRVKIKITQNSGYPNKEHNVIFEHIHQNNRAYPRSKKNLHWSMIGKMLLHPGKNPSKVRCRKTTRKILQFLLSFNEDGNSSTYTDAKLLYKHEHFFELNHKLGALQTCHAWKTILTNWQNMESKGPKKSQFLSSLGEGYALIYLSLLKIRFVIYIKKSVPILNIMNEIFHYLKL